MLQLIPIGFLVAASWTDVRARKIRNHITYPMAASGLLVEFLISGKTGLVEALIGMSVAGGLLCIIPGFRHGGGDIKLAGACGAWIGTEGLQSVLAFMVFTLASVWVASVIVLAKKEGWAGIRSRVLIEILSGLRASQPAASLPGAPFLLFAYVVAVIR
ncbi:MAG: prepilin peptidase [Bacillota bacterium]